MIIITIILLVCLYGSVSERREWNGGTCAKNGLRWKHFDTDSQGGRGYRAGDQVIWISWPGIDGGAP